MTSTGRSHRFATTLAALAIALAITSSASAAGPSATDRYQWNFNSSAPQANTYNADYSIANVRNDGEFLTGRHKTFGASLDFGDGKQVTTGLRRWSFRRRGGATGPIAPSEHVAMYDNFTHQFLVRRGQHFGIDLDFSATPVYDWEISAKFNGYGTLYNTDERDYLVFAQRTVGPNLGWLRDVAGDANVTLAANRYAGVTLNANLQLPVAPGYIPFTATFGAGPNGYGEKLLSVTVPRYGWQTGFVKRGYTTADCANPAAAVWKRQDEKLSAAELVAVFGSATPALPVAISACVVNWPGETTGLQSDGISVGYFGLTL